MIRYESSLKDEEYEIAYEEYKREYQKDFHLKNNKKDNMIMERLFGTMDDNCKREFFDAANQKKIDEKKICAICGKEINGKNCVNRFNGQKATFCSDCFKKMYDDTQEYNEKIPF